MASQCVSRLRLASVLAVATVAAASAAPLTLATGGKASAAIVVAPDATVVEKHAASELSTFLAQITGGEFPVQETSAAPAGNAILVGPSALVAQLAPDLKLDTLKPDGLVMESRGQYLILAGDRPRGTLYAVYTFLEDVLGCRWWSSKVSSIPTRRDLVVPEQHVRYVPPLEYREPFWSDAFDADWAARNKSNGSSTRLDEARGGKVSYGGLFVHTVFNLVPPEKHFAAHPEWYSELDGKRIGGGGEYVQLCVTNEELKKFTAQQVLDYLKAHPEANIISVSQNDTDNHCLCATCKKLEEEEGSPAGPLLHFVNYVAAEVAKQYPNVAIDTLAYQYTRKPPLHVKPLPNVIVRLCSIECDFSRPLTAPSNQKFADDIRGWSKICQRLYIWDYTTNFSHYLLPHPNLRVLGPNVRFFVENGVKGIFEQGAYTSLGAEFAELKAWVLAKVLWNPQLDNDALVAEFVQGYYGPAAPCIGQYIKLIHDEALAKNTYLTCFSSLSAEFLNLEMLGQAEALFVKAEAAAKDDPGLLQRVQVARLPLRYVWSRRWAELQDRAGRAKLAWPGPANEVDNAKTFSSVAQAYGVTMISEGTPLDTFEKRTTGMGRIASPPPPGCENLPAADVFDLQDSGFSLYQEGTLSSLEHDDLASDKVAARMLGSTLEWATQLPLTGKPWDPDALYTAYAAIRVEKTGNAGGAFTAGIYDSKNSQFTCQIAVPCAEVADDQYHVYKLGTARMHGDVFLWAAPPKNPDNVKYVWVDRFWVVREKGATMKVQGESLVLAASVPGKLCFDQVVKGSVTVRSTYLAGTEKSVVYQEGKDYVVDYEQGTVARTAASAMPDFAKNILFGQKDFDHTKFAGFSNHPFFVWVDYTTTNGKAWARANDQTPFLAKSRAKLEAGGPFRIVSYGDSITAGGEASTPDLRFQAMFGKYLQRQFPKAVVTVEDASISGYASLQGIEWWDKYIEKTSPDLVLVGWGMNDHNIGNTEPEQFRKNLVTLVGMIRERKGAEVILFSAFPPNDDWHYGTHRMGLYAAATRQAAAEAKCAYVDVWSTWEMVLRRKDQPSLLGNNINHPNDFGHWLYEQAFEAMRF